MVRDGLMEDFAISEVYGMHNHPGMAVGTFATPQGADHGCGRPVRHPDQRPQRPCRPATQIDRSGAGGGPVVVALQSIAARETDPLKSVV